MEQIVICIRFVNIDGGVGNVATLNKQPDLRKNYLHGLRVVFLSIVVWKCFSVMVLDF